MSPRQASLMILSNYVRKDSWFLEMFLLLMGYLNCYYGRIWKSLLGKPFPIPGVKLTANRYCYTALQLIAEGGSSAGRS